MYKIIDLQQGSEEWLSFRECHIGASDAPIIMGKSPWMTMEELWEIKAGFRKPKPKTAKMQRGNDLEDEARKLLNEQMKMEFRPIVLQSIEYPFLSASLDGINDGFNTICEIKCPNDKTHKDALNGIVPEYYEIQIQHQLLISDAKRCLYFSYRPEMSDPLLRTALVYVFPDHGLIQEIEKNEIFFWKSLIDGKAPKGCWTFTHKPQL